ALPVDCRRRHRRARRGRGVMMNPTEFLKARIAEWEAKSKEAGGNADFKAFEFAESEIKNYKAMLKTYERPD
ncbi:TPA: hypothetical protein ACFB3E_002103, partial [Neisseria gonorrhoeae]